MINNLKSHYKQFAIMKLLLATDNNSEVRITVLDALYMMLQLWAKVTKATIANCFRHTKFIHSSVDNTDDHHLEDENDPDDVPLACLTELGIQNMQEFMNAAIDIPTSMLTNDNDIIKEPRV